MGGGEEDGPFFGDRRGLDGGMVEKVDEEAAGELKPGADGVLVGVEEGGGEFIFAEGAFERAGLDVVVLDAAPVAVWVGAV